MRYHLAISDQQGKQVEGVSYDIYKYKAPEMFRLLINLLLPYLSRVEMVG
jgi:hypothetical protein